MNVFSKISIPCKKYGVDLIKFLSDGKEKALHTSKNGWDGKLHFEAYLW